MLIKMSKLYSISQAAQQLGVAVSTLRRWEYEGKLTPQRTRGNQRRYSAEQLMGMGRKLPSQSERVTLAYARVSSADQKQDLERQKTVLEMYCAAQGWTFELISDLGSGMNYRKKGLQSLLEKLLNGKIERLVITNNDVLRSEMQLTDDRLSLQRTQNDLVLASQHLDILLGLRETLLIRPDTAILHRPIELESYETYVGTL